MPMESIKRTDKPTTYMDEAHIPRVPKRTDMFARAQFGDMGKAVQEGATGGYYAKKAPTSFAQRRHLVRLFCCKMAQFKAPRRLNKMPKKMLI